MCRNGTELNRNKYESMKNKAKKDASKAMREKAEKVINEWKNYRSGVFGLI